MKLEDVPPIEDFTEIMGDMDSPVIPLEEAISKKSSEIDYFKTGYSTFDEAMEGGLTEGNLVIISGISGEGKTTLAQSITHNLCNAGVPCLWFSYEVSFEHLDKKFRDMGTHQFYSVYVPKKMTTGKLDWVKYKIKESWRKHGTKIVFIDHIDFLMPEKENKTYENQALNLKQIALELKTLAIELKIAVVVMAHLKKLPEGKEPDMQDIGYSAGIFQLADFVLIIMRERQKKKFSENQGEVIGNGSVIKIVKNRATGRLVYIKTQFVNGKFLELTNIYESTEYQPVNRYVEGIS
jgi:replicative DNA helicase